ncbi:MAG: hypothetical protein Q7R39_00780 [Dehalococcoidia bacterium]|nr:hypothetical protein [Dehalococcoidia bacterium]
MAQPLVQPTGNAGELYIPALGQTIKLVEWREDDFYDSVQQAAGLVTAGTSLEVFRDLTNKNLQHTNLKTQRRIPAGSQFIMNRIGVLIAQSAGSILCTAKDILRVAYSASLTFKINDRLVSEGPIVKYQSGLGITGGSTENAVSAMTTGVASAAAAPNLLVSQPVMDDDDLQATIDFKSNTWLATTALPTLDVAPVFTTMLHGFIKKPTGK